MSGDTSNKILRVAVIGAGAAGLCAARHLASKPHLFQPYVFEKSDQVGGAWVYTEDVGKDKYGQAIHSSMYWNMKTNLSKEAMQFIDYPFDKRLPSFLPHQTVLQYLQDYSRHFDLHKYIRFKTCVDIVKPVQPSSDQKRILWDVGYRGVEQSSDDIEIEQFDAVLVCNGHYSNPDIPDIPGMDSFRGEMIHVHEYRHPEVYRNKRVVILGAAMSGIDMALELSPFANQIILSHNKSPLVSTLPSNVSQAKGIKSLNGTKVLFKDDKEADTDVLMFCTGYKYTFPFLTSECNVRVDDGRITPLYKHITHAQFPTLSFIGIPQVCVPFPLFDCQVRFTLAILDGSMQLPSCEEMEKDIETDYNWRRDHKKLAHRHAHQMGDLQWEYNDQLCEMAKIDTIPRMIAEINSVVDRRRNVALMFYKADEFEITGPESWRMSRMNTQL